MGWFNYGGGETLYVIFLEARPAHQRCYDKALACQPAQIAAVPARGVPGGEYTDRKTSLYKMGKWRVYFFCLQRVQDGHD